MSIFRKRGEEPGANFRRLLSAACALAGFALVPPLLALRGRYAVAEVKPGVFVWVPEDILDLEGDPKYELAGTAGFVITGDGVVVINSTNSPFHGRELLYEIRERTELPVRYVINTDARPDHVLGNEVFTDVEAKIVASKDAREQFDLYRQELARRLPDDFRLQERMRGIHPTLPTVAIDSDSALRVGGVDFKLVSVRGGPTPGESAVYLPSAKVLFLGDVYENGYIPQTRGADLKTWVALLRKLESWDVNVYVPGHGPPSGRQEFSEFRRFFEWLATEPAGTVPEDGFLRVVSVRNNESN